MKARTMWQRAGTPLLGELAEGDAVQRAAPFAGGSPSRVVPVER